MLMCQAPHRESTITGTKQEQMKAGKSWQQQLPTKDFWAILNSGELLLKILHARDKGSATMHQQQCILT